MSVILVAHQSPMTREVLQRLFVHGGHTVLTAEAGPHALATARAEQPDLVVVDTGLPGLDGVALTRILKSEDAPPLVAVLADSDSEREQMRARTAGADIVIAPDEASIQSLPDLLNAERPPAGSPTAGRRAGAEESGDDGTDQGPAAVLQALSARYERELFVAEVTNRIWEIGERMQSLEQTAGAVLQTLLSVLDADVAAVILRYEREALVFAFPAARSFAEDVRQFIQIARDDFSRRPGTETVRSVRETVLGTDGREDYARLRIDGRRMSSYHTVALERSDGTFIGTLHVGHLTNNYFSGTITAEIERLTRPASVVLGNAVKYNETEGRRNKINTIFAKFVPAEVISDLLSQSEDAEMAVGEKRTVTILFSDIRSFTVISEHNSAESIVSFLNAYLERMVRIIRSHGGFIDKFIGDAILGIFGAPVSYEDNAARAVRAAREMAAAIPDVNVDGLVLPDAGFAIGVGVHEGTVIVGNIGSQDKFDYTVIGDNVNLASRLEGLTKHYHAQVLMSDVVYQKTADEINGREVDTVRVKGKVQPTTLYTVATNPRFDAAAADDYRKALRMYKLMNWSTATDYFRRVLVRCPDDYLATMYLDRCREFAEHPPDDDWGGAIKLDFK